MTANRRIIGVDESGKGDFFGPLVVAAFWCLAGDQPDLREMGVRDSKRIAEAKLLTIADRLLSTYPHAIIVYQPEEYNHRYAIIKNLNKLLAEGHARAIAGVVAEHPADLAISDKFGKPELIEQALQKLSVDIELRQFVRGEEILPVAAASILARATFVREIQKLSRHYQTDIPRGAGTIVDEAGRKIAATQPPQIFDRIAKTHFKNYRRIVNPTLELDGSRPGSGRDTDSLT